jgi:hypothetical protein
MRSLLAKTAQRVVGNPQAPGLLVEERSGAGGAQRVGGISLELAPGVELYQRDRTAADVDDV